MQGVDVIPWPNVVAICAVCAMFVGIAWAVMWGAREVFRDDDRIQRALDEDE